MPPYDRRRCIRTAFSASSADAYPARTSEAGRRGSPLTSKQWSTARSATSANSPTATDERLGRPPRALPGDGG